MIHALNSKLMHIFLQTVNMGRKALPANTNGEGERKKGLAQHNNVIREPVLTRIITLSAVNKKKHDP